MITVADIALAAITWTTTGFVAFLVVFKPSSEELCMELSDFNTGVRLLFVVCIMGPFLAVSAIRKFGLGFLMFPGKEYELD
jgi:hypothetical protein